MKLYMNNFGWLLYTVYKLKNKSLVFHQNQDGQVVITRLSNKFIKKHFVEIGNL